MITENDRCDRCGDDVDSWNSTYMCNICNLAICVKCRTICDTCNKIVCANNACGIQCPVKINNGTCQYFCFYCVHLCPICNYGVLCSLHNSKFCDNPCSLSDP